MLLQWNKLMLLQWNKAAPQNAVISFILYEAGTILIRQHSWKVRFKFSLRYAIMVMVFMNWMQFISQTLFWL